MQSLSHLLARVRADELRHAAATSRAARDSRPPAPARTGRGRPTVMTAVTLRFAFPDDRDAVACLAALDSASVPAEPMLLAEQGGALRAALSLADGAVIADPFHPSTSLIALLRARAQQLKGAGQVPTVRRWAWPLPRISIERRS